MAQPGVGDLEFQLPRDGGGAGPETPTDRKRRAAATKADRCTGYCVTSLRLPCVTMRFSCELRRSASGRL